MAMSIGSSLESAMTSLQRNVESAKNVAAQLSKAEEDASGSGGPTVNSNAETVGQIVDVEA